MTSIKQDFSMYAGDTANIIIGITDGNGAAASLSGASAIWVLEESVGSGSLLRKTIDNGISVSGSSATIALASIDTRNLDGDYYHELEITDNSENVSTTTTGTATIKKSGANL